MTILLITGAASGLGWALAQAYHRQGAKIILADINKQMLEERALALADPQSVFTFPIDLTNNDAVLELSQWVDEKFGRLDVLVNCAGITHRSAAVKTNINVFRKVIDIDYIAPAQLTIALLPLLRHCAGSIVTIGSMAGWMPVIGRAGYCAAKAALHQFFETLRCELADEVHQLMVYPSFLSTPIEQNALGHDGQPARHARSTLGKVRTPQWMGDKIIVALQRRQKRLFPDRFSLFASFIYRFFPAFYLRQMRKKFQSELHA